MARKSKRSPSRGRKTRKAEADQQVQVSPDTPTYSAKTDSTSAPDTTTNARSRKREGSRVRQAVARAPSDSEVDTDMLLSEQVHGDAPLIDRLEDKMKGNAEAATAVGVSTGVLMRQASGEVVQAAQARASAISAWSESCCRSASQRVADAATGMGSSTKTKYGRSDKKGKKNTKKRRPSWTSPAPVSADASLALRLAIAASGLIDVLAFAAPTLVHVASDQFDITSPFGLVVDMWMEIIWIMCVVGIDLALSTQGQTIGNLLTGTAVSRAPTSASSAEEAFTLQEEPRTGMLYTLTAAVLNSAGLGLVSVFYWGAMSAVMEANYSRISWVSDASKPFEAGGSSKQAPFPPRISRQTSLVDGSISAAELERQTMAPVWKRQCNDLLPLVIFFALHIVFWFGAHYYAGAELEKSFTQVAEGIHWLFGDIGRATTGGIAPVVLLYVACSVVVLIYTAILRSLARPVFWTAIYVVVVLSTAYFLFALSDVALEIASGDMPTVSIGHLSVAAPVFVGVLMVFRNSRDVDLTFECWRETIMWMCYHPLYMLYLPSMELLWQLYQIGLLGAVLVLWSKGPVHLTNWYASADAVADGKYMLALASLGGFMLIWTVCTMRNMLDVGISACFSQFYFDPDSRGNLWEPVSLRSLKRCAHGIAVSATTSLGASAALGILGYVNEMLIWAYIRLQKHGDCISLVIARLIALLRYLISQSNYTALVFAGARGMDMMAAGTRTIDMMTSSTATALLLADASWLIALMGNSAVYLMYIGGLLTQLKLAVALVPGMESVADLSDLVVAIVMIYTMSQAAWSLSVGTKTALICVLEELRTGRPLHEMRASPALVRAVVQYVERSSTSA